MLEALKSCIRLRAGLCAALLVCAAVSAQTEPVNARAASVTGPVLLSSRGASAFALTAGAVLSAGDVLDTRAGGSATIQLSDGSIILIQPGSLLTLKDFRTAGSLRELFEITLGRVRVKINHFGGRPNPYRMNSPTASIAVRGTEFSIVVGDQGETQVVVYEGAVEVSSLMDPSNKVLIEAGRGVIIAPGRAPQLLSALPTRETDQRPGSTELDTDHRQPSDQIAQNRPGQGSNDHSPPAPVGHSPPEPNSWARTTTPWSEHSASGRSEASTPGSHDENSPRATAGAYERYITTLSSIGQLPFLLRYNAFPEAHLDSLENPAWATGFSVPEARIIFLPSLSGVQGVTSSGVVSGASGTLPADYGVSSQASAFAPLSGSPFVYGGSVAASHLSNAAQGNVNQAGVSGLAFSAADQRVPGMSGTSTSSFLSGSLLAAARLGSSSSIGFEVESLRGSGSALTTINGVQNDASSLERIASRSSVLQTRITFGAEHDLSDRHKLAVFYRYGFVGAGDHDISHVLNGLSAGLDSTTTSGHSAEIGLRVRGSLTNRMFYGVTAAWLGLSLNDGLERPGLAASQQSNRGRRESGGAGLGFLIGRRTLLSFDAAGGMSDLGTRLTERASGTLLQTGSASARFVSMHWAVQADVTRRLFGLASFSNVWNSHQLAYSLLPDRSGREVDLSDSFIPINPAAYLVANHLSDFGTGWRFSPNLFGQYVFSTDYGFSPASHTVMVRYTFKLHGDEHR